MSTILSKCICYKLKMTSGGGIFQTITLGKEAIKYHEIISLDIKLYRNDCSAEKILPISVKRIVITAAHV